MDLCVLSFNIKLNSTLYYCAKSKLEEVADVGLVLAGFQEVPPSITNAAEEISLRVSRNKEKLAFYPLGNNVALYSQHIDKPVYFQSEKQNIQAVRHPSKIGFVNTHRSPSCDTGSQGLLYWTHLRATVSRLLAGGDDAMFVHGDPMKGVVIVGDFNADIDRDREARDASAEDNHLRNFITEFNLNVVATGPTFFHRDQDARRFDYILSTQNISLSTKIDKLETQISDHRAVFVKLIFRDEPINPIPFAEHNCETWKEFKRKVYNTYRPTLP